MHVIKKIMGLDMPKQMLNIIRPVRKEIKLSSSIKRRAIMIHIKSSPSSHFNLTPTGPYSQRTTCWLQKKICIFELIGGGSLFFSLTKNFLVLRHLSSILSLHSAIEISYETISICNQPAQAWPLQIAQRNLFVYGWLSATLVRPESQLQILFILLVDTPIDQHRNQQSLSQDIGRVIRDKFRNFLTKKKIQVSNRVRVSQLDWVHFLWTWSSSKIIKH